jgi:CAAX protease family protein
MTLRKIFLTANQLRAGWRLAVFCALVVGIAYAVQLLLSRMALPSYPSLHPAGLMIDDAVLLSIALAATAIMARIERRNLSTYGLPRLRDLFGRMFWRGALWGMGMTCMVILFMFLAGGYRVHGLNLTGWELLKFAILWLVANLLIGISEEILFRGYFLYTLADGIGFWTAAILESVGFGALHYFTKPNERWEDWLAVSLLTVFATLALRRTGNLAFPIGMHAAFDFAFIYMFSGRNGGELAVGRLLNAEFPGPSWLTGGLLGPEASWICFVVTVAAILLLHVRYKEARWGGRILPPER